MAWTPLDKISFEQLNSELQSIIDNKAGGADFNNLSSSFNSHLLDKKMHFTDNDRFKFDYMYERIVNALDQGVERAIVEFTTMVEDVKTHMLNTDVHWTDLDRNDYNTFRANLDITLANIQLQLEQIFPTADGRYITNAQYSNTVTDLANHMLDPHKHITPMEREKWNSVYNDAVKHSDTALYSHTIDSAKHVSDAERENWNAHKDNTDIHLTPEERSSYNQHISNPNIHVTYQQKNEWTSMKNTINLLEERIISLNNTVSVMNNAIANLQTKVAQLSLLM